MKKLLEKILGLTNLDVYLEKTERRFMDIESSLDDLDNSVNDFESRIEELEGKEILDYDSGDFLRDYECEDFVNVRNFEELEDELNLKIKRLTTALQRLAAESNIELRIDEILEGAEDE